MKTTLAKPMTILIADDDADDRMMIEDAFKESRLANDLRFAVDGEDLLNYLNRRGKYEDPQTSPRPGLILLDLNMPKKDGREALKEIRANPELRTIPVVVLTTSRAEDDVHSTYDTGVNSYIVKPVNFESLVEIARHLGTYWFQLVELPGASPSR